MTPEQLAREAARLTDRIEGATLKRVDELLQIVREDAIRTVRALDGMDVTRGRVFRRFRAEQAVLQSQAARDLLSMGRAGGPLAEEFRAGIAAAYRDGIRTAQAAAVSTGLVTAAEAAVALAFGTRVEVEFLEALTRTTITTLEKVSQDGVRRLVDAIARGAVRGAGPRATARLAREAVDLTRYEAERIVRTVFMRANNDARAQSYAELDIEFLQSNAANDTRTCAFCEARHGMVYKLKDAPQPPYHPHCRCVLLPWNPSTPPEFRGDAYYESTRAEMAARREREGRAGATATAAAPFERMDGIKPARPVWAPERGAP